METKSLGFSKPIYEYSASHFKVFLLPVILVNQVAAHSRLQLLDATRCGEYCILRNFFFLIQTPCCEYMTELRGVLYLFRQLTAVDINCKNWNSWGPFGFVHMGSRYENMIGAPSLKTHKVTLNGFQRMLSRLRKFHRYIFPGSWQVAFKSPVIVCHGWK